jgi:hypothetical protein
VADEDDRFALRVDDAPCGGGVVFERQRWVLDDADAVAILCQQPVDVLPAGAVDETPMDENDGACSSDDALLRDVGKMAASLGRVQVRVNRALLARRLSLLLRKLALR